MIDTNVLISYAFFNDAQICNVVDECFIKHDIYVDDYCLEEFARVVAKKFIDMNKSIKAMESILNMKSLHVVTSDPLNIYPKYTRDKKDNRIVHTAINTKMDILMTGDKDFNMKSIKDLRILTPREVDQFLHNI